MGLQLTGLETVFLDFTFSCQSWLQKVIQDCDFHEFGILSLSSIVNEKSDSRWSSINLTLAFLIRSMHATSVQQWETLAVLKSLDFGMKRPTIAFLMNDACPGPISHVILEH